MHDVSPRHQAQTGHYGIHHGRNNDVHGTHTTAIEAPAQPPGARKHAGTPQCLRAGAKPVRCGAPEAVLGPRTVVFGARGASGWVFDSSLLCPRAHICSICECMVCVADSACVYSVCRVQKECCYASSCASAGDDLMTLCDKCFYMCHLINVRNTQLATPRGLCACAQDSSGCGTRKCSHCV